MSTGFKGCSLVAINWPEGPRMMYRGRRAYINMLVHVTARLTTSACQGGGGGVT